MSAGASLREVLLFLRARDHAREPHLDAVPGFGEQRDRRPRIPDFPVQHAKEAAPARRAVFRSGVALNIGLVFIDFYASVLNQTNQRPMIFKDCLLMI